MRILLVILIALSWAPCATSRTFLGEAIAIGYAPLPSPNRQITAAAVGWSFSISLVDDGSLLFAGSSWDGVQSIPEPNQDYTAISAGHNHVLALKADGSIRAWGNTSDGKCQVPEPNEGFAAVEAGENHSVAIRADGSLIAWGSNAYGLCDVPMSTQRFVQVAAGETYDLALQEDGTVVAWGNNSNGQLNIPDPNQDFVDIAATNLGGMGLKRDGRVVVWGIYSQYISPPDGGVIDIDAFGTGRVFLLSDGTIWTNLGSAQSTGRTVSVTAGSNSGMAINAYNLLAYEGFNHDGSLPNGWTRQSQSPVLSTPWTPLQETGRDWAIRASQPIYGLPMDEWLITPVYDLRGVDVESLRFISDGWLTGGATAQLKCSANGGLSWTTCNTWTAGQNQEPLFGEKTIGLPSSLDQQANVRFAFVFHSDFVSECYWGIDDLLLLGQPVAPVATTPLPAQPPALVTGFVCQVGCTWQHPFGVNGASLQIRWDANGDGDYEDLGVERWHSLTEQVDGQVLSTQGQARWTTTGSALHFELRARAGMGAWGYSGSQNIQNIGDDWTIQLAPPPDLTAPFMSEVLPDIAAQAAWHSQRQQTVGCRIEDIESGIDAASLAMRVDWNGDGIYSAPNEGWQALSGYENGSSVTLRETLTLPVDGSFRVEFRASDSAGNGPVYLGGQAGPADDILLQIDGTPPTSSTLFASAGSSHSVTLQFTPAVDAHFARYEIRCSPDSTIDENDILWSADQDPNLAVPTSTTMVLGLENGHLWAFRLWAVDMAGNRSEGSNIVFRLAGGSAPAAISDLHAWRDDTGLHLQWSPPQTDVYGQTPLAIQRYRLYSGTRPDFQIAESSLLRIQTETGADFPLGTGDEQAWFRVTTDGAGPGVPSTGTAVCWGEVTYLPIAQENHDLVSVAVGSYQRLGLRNDGHLIAWGWGDNGLATVPEPDSIFRAIACGMDHNLALRQDGSILAWGANGPYTQVPEPNEDFIAIAAGYHHSLGLKSNGHLVTWGDNFYGQLSNPVPDSTFVAIAAGSNRSCGITVGGRLYMWGPGLNPGPANYVGYASAAIGENIIIGLRRNGVVDIIQGPANPPNLNLNFVSVACGRNYGLALRRDGVVFALGGGYSVPEPNGEQIAVAAYGSSFYVVRNVPTQ